MENQYPPSWVEASLPDVVYFQEGPGLRKFQFREEGVPFLNIQTLSNERVDKTKCKFLDLEEVKSKYSHFLLETNDIICSSSGTLGKTAIIREEDKPLMLNTSVIRFRPHSPDLFLRSYLHVFLKSQKFLRQARSASSGSAQVNFGPTHLVKFTIPVPPLNEQHRIVAKIEELFSELDKGIENLKTAQAQLKVYRQALLKHAFEGKLTAQWRVQNRNKLETAAALQQRIQQERAQRYQQQLADWEAGGKQGNKPKAPKPLPPLTAEELAELPELPDGWVYSYLSDLGDLGRGKSKHRPRNDPRLFGGVYPFVQTGEVKAANRIIRQFSQTYSDFGLQQSKLWPAGTLCITIAANIAETAFLGFDGCFPDSVVGFTAFKEIVDPEYVDFFIQAARTRIEAYAPATAQKNINLETLENLVVPYCSTNEQKQILNILEERLSEVDQLTQTINTALQQAEALRQSILKRAFAGLLVPQDPHDEPAAALLARIKAEGAQSAAPKRKGKSS